MIYVSARGQRFIADVPLRSHETDLVARGEGSAGRQEERIRVVWDRFSRPRYRSRSTTTVFFLRDIAQKQYASLFDCFYLKMLRDLHTKYGAKFSVNIYYTTGDDFTLPQFPDRYKGEWRDNADWLRLAFHAYANLPDGRIRTRRRRNSWLTSISWRARSSVSPVRRHTPLPP